MDEQDPAAIIAAVIAGNQHKDKDGKALVGRATRKKAQAVIDALAAAGWQITR